MAGKNKATLKIGYLTFVLEAKAAATLFQVLVESDMEMFDTTWNSETKLSEPMVKPAERDVVSLQMLPEEQYALGKLLYAADVANKQGDSK
jgi:hypothetical protein